MKPYSFKHCRLIQRETLPKEVQENFWENVSIKPELTSPCFHWVGPVTSKAKAPVFNFGSRRWQARRLSYALHYGQCPAGVLIYNSCRNKLCVNPDHLYPVRTHSHADKSMNITLTVTTDGSSEADQFMESRLALRKSFSKLEYKTLRALKRPEQGITYRVKLSPETAILTASYFLTDFLNSKFITEINFLKTPNES